MPGKIVASDEWLAARKALLVKEKAATHANQELAEERRQLPMVKIDKKYTFTSHDGSKATLGELFDGYDQLIVYHFMFSPEDDEGCRGCSHVGNSLPDVRHMRQKNTNLVSVSRAPADKIAKYRAKNGWTFPWYSSGDSDFNYDFGASHDDKVKPTLFNFRTAEELKAAGKKTYEGDEPGYTVFLKEGGGIYHTYSTFDRGLETIMPTLTLLDITPKGRQLGQYGPAEFKLLHEFDQEL